jgi:hypothetical protein
MLVMGEVKSFFGVLIPVRFFFQSLFSTLPKYFNLLLLQLCFKLANRGGKILQLNFKSKLISMQMLRGEGECVREWTLKV